MVASVITEMFTR